MKKNHVSRVPAFLMILLAGFLSFGSLRAEGSKADLASAAEAQQRTVTGKVVDAQGQPVAGASVMIPGTAELSQPRTVLSPSLSPRAPSWRSLS